MTVLFAHFVLGDDDAYCILSGGRFSQKASSSQTRRRDGRRHGGQEAEVGRRRYATASGRRAGRQEKAKV